MYPKSRLDALTDGIFAVAMTILVLDIRMPEAANPATNADLMHALMDLWPRFFPYVLSFLVLGISWLSGIKVRGETEHVDRPYAWWLLVYLLFVTCVPFSTLLVGRFSSFEAANSIYAINLGVMALAGYRLLDLTPKPQVDAHWVDRRISLIVLMGSCVLVLLVGLYKSEHALWCLLVNLGQRPMTRWYLARHGAP